MLGACWGKPVNSTPAVNTRISKDQNKLFNCLLIVYFHILLHAFTASFVTAVFLQFVCSQCELTRPFLFPLPQRCLTFMNRGFAFTLVNHYMCHFSLKDPKVRVLK